MVVDVGDRQALEQRLQWFGDAVGRASVEADDGCGRELGGFSRGDDGLAPLKEIDKPKLGRVGRDNSRLPLERQRARQAERGAEGVAIRTHVAGDQFQAGLLQEGCQLRQEGAGAGWRGRHAQQDNRWTWQVSRERRFAV